MKKAISVILIMILMVSISGVTQADGAPSTKSSFRQLAQVSTTVNSRSNNARVIQEICYAWNAQTRTKLGSIDGVFGSNSKSALQQFQTDVGISSDGVCGPNTYGKIYDNLRVYSWSSGSSYLIISYRPGGDCEYGVWNTFSNLQYLNDSSGVRYRFYIHSAWRNLKKS